MATLDTMPSEIIQTILVSLLAPPPEIGEPHPGTYNQLNPDLPWFGFTRSRRGLHSMCLVSRRLSAIACPLLYRVVPIWHEKAMVLFFRTLCCWPNHGNWTRYYACHITLTTPSVVQEFCDLLRLPLSAPAAVHTLLDMLLRSLQDPAAAPQVLLASILTSLTKVETVLLQVPVAKDQQEYDVLCDQIGAIKDRFCGGPHGAPFQHIRTLLLQGDPDSEDDWGARPGHYGRLFAGFPNLTTLEVSSDRGVWTPPHDKPQPPFMPNLRHIYLHNSATSPVGLHHLLRNAPMLETLYMDQRSDSSLRESIDVSQSKALNIALAKHAKHLQDLDVSWNFILGFERFVGPDGRLISLANMQCLRSLRVQMPLLYGKPSAVPETSLIDLLPPNLVKLTLEDWWWDNVKLLDQLPDWGYQERVGYYKAQGSYRVSVINALVQFASDMRQQPHSLKKVVLLCRIPWTWVPERSVSLEFHFEQVGAMFLKQGVKFSVESDEDHDGRVQSVVFSPDGRRLASGSGDGIIKIWDALSGRCVGTLEGHDGSVQSVAFSPDGQRIASGSSDWNVKIWNLASGRCIDTLHGHSGSIDSVAFSPDGQRLASGSDDETIKIWDVTSGRCVNTLEGHEYSVWSVAFSPDGLRLASGSSDETVKIWDIAWGRCVKTLEGYGSPDSVHCVLA
ncbi:hypothetical protein C8A01DRAFT_36379 [Parachaetomium inaequale]|uniref:WD40 repeat-like protein n=1 Tax=Parachaetomium inaequale TaxID=2588326 RepID=A0AAN6PET7_9PEZI|nr:hypothetical protein C8A01DRAFT_36379 [Parachaetomium inaequale]